MNKKETISKPIDRPMAAAGTFYSANPEQLKASLKDAFSKAKPCNSDNPVLAIVCPHAGYLFSASVAASAYRQIDTTKNYEHIFIIGSSHRLQFKGASIYTSGDYVTPLGHVKMDPLGAILVKQYSVFNDDPSPHFNEHTIEVQLPFLQYLLHGEFRIIPIVLGTQQPETCKKIARALLPYLNTKNLFIFSTDFSHYPSWQDARISDSITSDAVISNNPETFLSEIHRVEEVSNFPGLLTTMCGWPSVLSMLDMTSAIPGITIRKVDYQNSGDILHGDRSRVVGYTALSVEEKNDPGFTLNHQDEHELLHLARESITEYLQSGSVPEPDTTILSYDIRQPAGVFVTLKVNDELRGCIGTMLAVKPLYKNVRDMAIAAATSDYRFEPILIHELPKLKIEISVISPMHKISSLKEIVLGKHGIYIRKGGKSGTLLPQVPVEHHWNLEEFLGYCARDKAGIGWNGWKTADIYVYEAHVFQE